MEKGRDPECASLSLDYAADTDIASQSEADDLWIFGFGSLIWKADEGLKAASRASVESFIRDRQTTGTPEAPGRTVTLESESSSKGGIVVGAAYLLSGTPSEQQQTIQELEWREKQYDVRQYVAVFRSAEDTSPLIDRALLYIASPKNANYLGPAPEEDIARQIAFASGPSGPNSEYLFRLAQAVREMGAVDPHLEWLDKRVSMLLQRPRRKI